MNVFIIGVSGYLGNRLASHLESQGFTVAGSSRAGGATGGRVSRLVLGEPVDPAVFKSSSVVIHAAHDFRPGAIDRNIDGARACLAAAKAAGVKAQIFLSSYSARADASSEYGRTKYRIEQMFLESGETVLRPGLVVGNGGLFARQRGTLLRTVLVPIVGDGTVPVAVVAVSHFLEAAEAVVRGGKPGAYSLFYDQRPTLRQFVRAVKRQAGQRCVFAPVPAGLAAVALRCALALRIRLPADPDQIKSLQSNRTSPWRSDLPALLPTRQPEFNLEYALAQLACGL